MKEEEFKELLQKVVPSEKYTELEKVFEAVTAQFKQVISLSLQRNEMVKNELQTVTKQKLFIEQDLQDLICFVGNKYPQILNEMTGEESEIICCQYQEV